MSNHIGTRNIGQVRSHLQKYLLKQKKLKEKQNKNSINKNDDNKSNNDEVLYKDNNKGIQLEENEEEEIKIKEDDIKDRKE